MHIEWIECSVKQPEESGRYLCNTDGYVYIDYYIHDENSWRNDDQPDGVTHWAHLPYGIKE